MSAFHVFVDSFDHVTLHVLFSPEVVNCVCMQFEEATLVLMKK